MHTSTLSLDTSQVNLRALCEHLSIYPSQTVQQALDLLGIDLPSVSDLLDLSGADACEALEAELLIQQQGWAA